MKLSATKQLFISGNPGHDDISLAHDDNGNIILVISQRCKNLINNESLTLDTLVEFVSNPKMLDNSSIVSGHPLLISQHVEELLSVD